MILLVNPGAHAMRLNSLPFALALALFAAQYSQAQQPGNEPPRKAGDVVIEAASVKPAGLGQVEFELGTLYVPENRAERGSRLIGVGFARFKAEKKSDAPPIFLLPGGPGGSYVDDLRPGNASAGLVRQLLQYRAIADVVVVDQRGFSQRGDVLLHRYRTPDEPLDQPASLERSTAAFTGVARSAVAAFEKQGIDLRGYTVKECADDVDDLRRALGYEQITLVGVSFGSQWSFAVMRRHPERVARALLSGVEPLDCGYDMPSHVLAAVHRMWREAEQDERLKPYLPPGGLNAAAREVLRRLEREPIRVPLKGRNGADSREATTIVLGHEDFQRCPMLRTAAGPEFVLALYHERYEPWALMTSVTRRSRTAEFPLIGPLIDTSLGVTPGRRYLLRSDAATAFLGEWNFDSYLASADIWPSPDVGDDFRTEVPCPIPVVFVHGNWDVQTPVENLLHVIPYFRNGRVLLVERGGHGAMNQVVQYLPETRQALLGFLRDGSTANLPTRVSVPAPQFSLPNFPPPQR
jgi:pimeloyl-ACP methyl ester carboxylesterase